MLWCLTFVCFFGFSTLALGQTDMPQPQPVEVIEPENEENIDEEPEPPVDLAVLTVYVTHDAEQPTPIKQAKVIVTYANGKEFERRTNSEGIAVLSRLPYGKVDIDVIASGMKSDGETRNLNQPETTLKYTLKARHSS